ncbi:hypothetical protein A4X09_0g4151 [Tilletia walkeri]|uniref:M-phase inducer phosphatase n=1 Tax=Tilletia walkeri TaxID=117179 RepID=A0A8X7N6N6_9BASI|nr:hypothetical protein A4X09_0g4151 [Tilletia walkeri]
MLSAARRNAGGSQTNNSYTAATNGPVPSSSSDNHNSNTDNTLPLDFDKSFESSMSLSDSLEHLAARSSFPRTASASSALSSSSGHGHEGGARTQEGFFDIAHQHQQHHHYFPLQHKSSRQVLHSSTGAPARHAVPSNTSPTRPLSLGAALGTQLNRQSPNLAAKGMTSRFSPPNNPRRDSRTDSSMSMSSPVHSSPIHRKPHRSQAVASTVAAAAVPAEWQDSPVLGAQTHSNGPTPQLMYSPAFPSLNSNGQVISTSTSTSAPKTIISTRLQPKPRSNSRARSSSYIGSPSAPSPKGSRSRSNSQLDPHRREHGHGHGANLWGTHRHSVPESYYDEDEDDDDDEEDDDDRSPIPSALPTPDNFSSLPGSSGPGVFGIAASIQDRFSSSSATSTGNRTPSLGSSATAVTTATSSSTSSASSAGSAKSGGEYGSGGAAAVLSPLGRMLGTELSLNDSAMCDGEAGNQTPKVLIGALQQLKGGNNANHSFFGPSSSSAAMNSGLGITMNPRSAGNGLFGHSSLRVPGSESPGPVLAHMGTTGRPRAASAFEPHMYAPPPPQPAMGTTAKIRGRAARDDQSFSPGGGLGGGDEYGWSPTKEPPMKKRPSIVALRSGSGASVRPAGMLSQRPPLQKSATVSAASALAELHAASRAPAVHFVSLPSRAGKLSAGPLTTGNTSASLSMGNGNASLSSGLARPIRGLGKRSLSLAVGGTHTGAPSLVAGSVFGGGSRASRPIPSPLQSAGPFSTTFPENVIAAHELPTASGGRIPKSSSGPIPTTTSSTLVSPDTSMRMMGAGDEDGAEEVEEIVDGIVGVGDMSDFFNNPHSPENSFDFGAAGSRTRSASASGSLSASTSGRGPNDSVGGLSLADRRGEHLADISGGSVLDGPPPPARLQQQLGKRTTAADRRMPSLTAAFADRSMTESERSSSPPMSSPLQGRHTYALGMSSSGPVVTVSAVSSGNTPARSSSILSARPRLVEKSHSVSVIPSIQQQQGAETSMPRRSSMIGKRPSLFAALPTSSSSSASLNTGLKPWNEYGNGMLAPRRIQSTGSPVAPPKMRSSGSMGADISAADLSTSASDSFGPSPLAARRPVLLRQRSKDDSSPSVNARRHNRERSCSMLDTTDDICVDAAPMRRSMMDEDDEGDVSMHVGSSSSGQLQYPTSAHHHVGQRHTQLQNLQSPAPSSAASDLTSPGIGDAVERYILPAETGGDDRLMRLKPETMIQLLNGGFDEVVSGYTIIDCRYSYEYRGGHIPGAVNLRTLDEIKDYLLTPRSGLNANSDKLPPRTTTGRNRAHKHVLIFHCEFSQKRAPKMASALRDLDRSLAQDWPRCHYPELYILSGGYAGFYKFYPAMCQPRQYIRELEPSFEEQWKAETKTFQKQFMRHKSMPVPRRLQRTKSESAAQMMLTSATNGMGGGAGEHGGSGSSGGGGMMSNGSENTPSRPPLTRAAGSSMAVLGSTASSCSAKTGTSTSTMPLANRTNVMLGPTAGPPARFSNRQPGLGPRAVTASYVPMMCSGGSTMIREASREGDNSFSP